MGRKKPTAAAKPQTSRSPSKSNSPRSNGLKRAPINKLLAIRAPSASTPKSRSKKATSPPSPIAIVEERDTASLLNVMKRTAASTWRPLEVAEAKPASTPALEAAAPARLLSTENFQPGLSELVPLRARGGTPPPQVGRGTQTDDIPGLVYSPPDHVSSMDTQFSAATVASSTNTINTIILSVDLEEAKPTKSVEVIEKKVLATAKRHECTMCNKVMGSRSDLVKHIRIHTGERPYQCSYCTSRFTQLGSLRAHETRHTGIKPFKCDLCDKSFSIKERLKVHKRIHTGERPFSCDLCEKAFARGSQLIQHKRTHTGDKPYTCSYCGMKFAFATNLKLHEKKHSGIKDYECPRCYKGFVRQDALRKHILSFHENERPMRCPICDKTFKGHLGTHLRVHTQEKPFICMICEAAFAQNSQLTVHQRTHTGVKPYCCQVCPQKFAHSTALKVHLRQHTGEKPYRCPLCKVVFNQLPHLKKHLRSIHKQEHPYMCGACKHFFKTKAAREHHVETDHPEYSGRSGAGPEFGVVDTFRSEILEPETLPEVITRGGMAVSKLRGYLAILMKKISTTARLQKFGFGRRLIDEVLKDSLETAGKTPFREGGNDVEILRANVQLLLDWTIPRDYMEQYRKERKTVEEILEELAS